MFAVTCTVYTSHSCKLNMLHQDKENKSWIVRKFTDSRKVFSIHYILWKLETMPYLLYLVTFRNYIDWGRPESDVFYS